MNKLSGTDGLTIVGDGEITTTSVAAALVFLQRVAQEGPTGEVRISNMGLILLMDVEAHIVETNPDRDAMLQEQIGSLGSTTRGRLGRWTEHSDAYGLKDRDLVQ